jgi:NADPH:quinone reductase-like Zn-dependent oxidoreductase
MRVFQLEKDWGMDHLRLSQRAEPVAGTGQVIIRMRASSLNFRDLVVVDRGYGRTTGTLPLVVLSDGAGDIVDVGAGVSRVRVGDRVCPTFFQNWTGGEPRPENFVGALGGSLDGTMAELMAVSEQGVVKLPDILTYEEAATLPCAALTAWSAVVVQGHVKTGDKILVQGSGGVAQFALAFAKAHGAHVTVISSSDEKLERLKQAGADVGINYTTHPDWAKAARPITADNGGFDNIIELGGETTFAQSLRAVRPGGTISVIGVLSGLNLATSLGPIVSRQIRLQGITVGHRNGFEEMLRAMVAMHIKPVIDRCFAFTELKDAMAYLKSGRQFGKVVVTH